MACSTKITGNHHLQGNVQVYNVRIPVKFRPPEARYRMGFVTHNSSERMMGVMLRDGKRVVKKVEFQRPPEHSLHVCLDMRCLKGGRAVLVGPTTSIEGRYRKGQIGCIFSGSPTKRLFCFWFPLICFKKHACQKGGTPFKKRYTYISL